MRQAESLPRSEWQEHYGAFKKMLPTVSNAHSPSDIFRDVCRIFSLSLRGAVTIDKAERDEIKEAPKEIDVRQLVQAEFSFGKEG